MRTRTRVGRFAAPRGEGIGADASPTVVLTGGTSGFGEALAHELAALGANVVVSGRDARRAAEVARAIGEDHALGVACDVCRADEIDALWVAAADRFGRVDHWINNAGVGHLPRRLDGLTPEEIAKVLDTNLTGALLGARRALRGMLAQGGGRIWLTEGLGSAGPVLAGSGVYGASKAGATYAYRVLTKEFRDTPVRVAFLRPGIMPTRVARHFAPRILRAARNGQRVTWLTPGRAARRLLAALFRKRNFTEQRSRPCEPVPIAPTSARSLEPVLQS